MREEVMEGLWRGDDDDDGDDFPLTGGQFSLQISSPGKNRGFAAAPRRRSEKRLLFQSFLDERVYRGPGRSPGGVGPTQEGRWRGQGWGRARHPPGCPLAALCPPLGHPEASGTLIFYIIFWYFSSVPKYPETCTKE